VSGVEVVVGFLIAWLVRRAKHVGERIDGKIDATLDEGLDKLHDVVARKLGKDPALAVLEDEIAEAGEATTRTQARVRLALEEAVEGNEAFAAELAAAIRDIQAASRGPGTIVGDHAVTVAGNVSATGGGIAIGGVTGGSVGFTLPDPPEPTRTQG